MDSSVSPKDEIWFLRVCHHISTGLYNMVIRFTLSLIGKRLPVTETSGLLGYTGRLNDAGHRKTSALSRNLKPIFSAAHIVA